MHCFFFNKLTKILTYEIQLLLLIECIYDNVSMLRTADNIYTYIHTYMNLIFNTAKNKICAIDQIDPAFIYRVAIKTSTV